MKPTRKTIAGIFETIRAVVRQASNEHLQVENARIRSELARVNQQLAEELTFRRIHRNDAVEIEMLLRMVALPNLPARPGREAALADLIGTNICEALYILDALHKSLRVEGAICEFGVAQGATSRLIAEEIMPTDRIYYLFDLFEGLPAPTEKDKLIDDIFDLGSMAAYRGTMRSPETEVLSKLDAIGFPPARRCVMKGWVDQTLARSDAPKSVAFAYIDFDLCEPIRVALNYLQDHTATGAHIVVDDYGFFSEGAQVATDEFVAKHRQHWSLSKPIIGAGHFVTLHKLA